MKILSVLALTASVVTAAPYVGLSIGFSTMKDNLKFSGHDGEGLGQDLIIHKFSHNKNSRLNTLAFGLLGGYSFKLNDKVSLLAEADFTLASKKKTLAKFDAHPNGDIMKDVEISTRRKHSFGFMPAASYNFTDKVSGLVGLRLNCTKHEVTGHITNNDSGDNELVKGSKHVMGVEPTVGLGFKVSDKMATRLTVGYNLGKKTTIVKQVVTNTPQLRENESSGQITIKPRGVNVRLAMTYSF